MKLHDIRRLIGKRHFDVTLAVAIADEKGSISDEEYLSVAEFVAQVKALYPEMLPPPAVVGGDLIAMGFKPSPLFKESLDWAYDRQLDGVTPDVVKRELPFYMKQKEKQNARAR